MLEKIPIIGFIDRSLRVHGPFGIPLLLGVLYLGAAAGAAITLVDPFSVLPTIVVVGLYGVVGISVTLGALAYQIRWRES
jgi:hypothetical protein